jgi:hypothetical protein
MTWRRRTTRKRRRRRRRWSVGMTLLQPDDS